MCDSKEKRGVGTEECATPECSNYAAKNMALCETCITEQKLNKKSNFNDSSKEE